MNGPSFGVGLRPVKTGYGQWTLGYPTTASTGTGHSVRGTDALKIYR